MSQPYSVEHAFCLRGRKGTIAHYAQWDIEAGSFRSGDVHFTAFACDQHKDQVVKEAKKATGGPVHVAQIRGAKHGTRDEQSLF